MTDLRQSQALLEVWASVGSSARAVVSQAILEAWINRLPVASTAEIVSQAVAEVWGTNLTQMHTELVVSQATLELWMSVAAAASTRVFWLSSQTV